MRSHGSLEHISGQLERIVDGQEECNRLLDGMSHPAFIMHETKVDDWIAKDNRIKQLEAELAEANEKLADSNVERKRLEMDSEKLYERLVLAEEHEQKAVKDAEGRMRGMSTLSDPFVEFFGRREPINQKQMNYWKTMIETHVTDEHFNCFDHAITHLIDKYPNRKEA